VISARTNSQRASTRIEKETVERAIDAAYCQAVIECRLNDSTVADVQPAADPRAAATVSAPVEGEEEAVVSGKLTDPPLSVQEELFQ